MNQIKMMLLFTECAKKFIPDIDEVELDWQFRVNECDFDKNGPCCSDGALLDIFRKATYNKIDDAGLYRTIEHICMCYCYDINSIK